MIFVAFLIILQRMAEAFYYREAMRQVRCNKLSVNPWSFEEARQYARSFGFGSKEEYLEYRCPGAYALPRDPIKEFTNEWTSWSDFLGIEEEKMTQVMFIEVGFGVDGHGQNVTKATVRAARNAIEFNSIPCVADLVPGGRHGLKLKIDIAIPQIYHKDLDLSQVYAVFPYGTIISTQIQSGGALFSSGIALAELGDQNDQMLVAAVAVTVGY
mmetsp:Transcript_22650/g.29339  ORF Transcript_22650/g.29339 Transcript_22650/m.29339 type:complete len:213 (+) Transcript_22650:45-683(+)